MPPITVVLSSAQSDSHGYVVLPVETVFPQSRRGIGVGHVPAGDVQRFAVCGGELPLAVLF